MVILEERLTGTDAIRLSDGDVNREGLLERVALTLNSELELWEVLKSLASLTRDAARADRCSVFLLEGQVLHPAAAIGLSRDDVSWQRFKEMGPVDISSIPAGWETLTEGCALALTDAGSSELIPQDWIQRFALKSLVLVPLLYAGEPCGVMTLDYGNRRTFTDKELRLLEAIGSYAGVAVRNARLFEGVTRQLRRAEVLHDLADIVTQPEAQTLVSRLNQLLIDQGVEVLSIALRDRTRARLVGAEPLSNLERKAWRTESGWLPLAEEMVSIPMRAGRQLVGAIRVKATELDDQGRSFLETLAHAVAEILERAAMQAKVAEAARERAVAQERGRIAADLHDTAGQLFVAIGLLSRREAEQVPDDSPWSSRLIRLAELAEQGKWEIDRAIQALSSFPAARKGLAASLRALARGFEEDSGIGVQVDVEGSRRLPVRLEQILYRVTHEAITNAWRHARCENVRISLDLSGKEVRLSIVDDGVGMRSLEGGRRAGVANMRRAVDEVGGDLRISNIKPHGVLVEASIPRDSR